MKKSEISLAIMVLKYGLDDLQYLWDPLIAFFMAEFPSQAHFLGLTHVSGQKRAPGHGTPFCALVRTDADGRTATPVLHAWPILFIRCPMGVFLSIFSAASNLFLNAPSHLSS